MKLNILISTYNQGIDNVEKNEAIKRHDNEYKVSHQVTDEKYEIIPASLKRNDIDVMQSRGRGISKNRNMSIDMASGEICLIADDDVTYLQLGLEKILAEFKKDPNLDVLVGQIQTPSGQPQYKKYPQHEKRLGYASIGGVSSIEIAFKLRSIRDNNIRFDERFGIGSNMYSRGEEIIFLGDCIKKRLKVKYFPIPFVCHEYQSSGKKCVYNEEDAKYYGALLMRIFGKFAYLLLVVIWIKHHKYFKAISLNKYITSFSEGIHSIMRKSEG